MRYNDTYSLDYSRPVDAPTIPGRAIQVDCLRLTEPCIAAVWSLLSTYTVSSSGIRVPFSQQCSTSQWIAFPIRLGLDNPVAKRFRADATRHFSAII